MKKYSLFAIGVAAALVGCSSDDVINDSTVRKSAETPIGFNVQKQNITRAANLETVKHYNFGVWAWKVQGKNSLTDAEVMNHYLVGYSDGTSKGYYADQAKNTTWSNTDGVTTNHNDHLSPWFYEGLGTAEYAYTAAAGFYKSEDDGLYKYDDYKSVNANQYLRYWDLAYEKTNFYCYAPYNKNVTFTKDATTSTMTFPATGAIRDGYDMPQNSAYGAYSRTLGEFMYAGQQATNSNLDDVTLSFKHMGAQLFIRFYEDVPGYKVEIIDLAADKATAPTDDVMKGIQAAPSVKTAGTPDTYAKGYYYTTSGATVSFAETTAAATYTPWWTDPSNNTNLCTKVQTPLMFKIPQTGDTYETYSVAPGNLTAFAATQGNTTSHNVIAEKGTGGTQTYSYSPTIYYPVAQPQSGASEYTASGFTFHVSYRVIAEDNGEVITVHNATVHVPVSGTVTGDDTNISSGTAPITAWNANVKYNYTFKITRGSTGTTDPDTTIDPTDPTPSTIKSLYPIVFDAATIEEWKTNESEYVVSEGTSYD